MKYPFLFMVRDAAARDVSKWIVIIVRADYTGADVDWMNHSSLPTGYTHVPDVDLVHAEYYFDKEEDALKFIKGWWASHTV